MRIFICRIIAFIIQFHSPRAHYIGSSWWYWALKNTHFLCSTRPLTRSCDSITAARKIPAPHWPSLLPTTVSLFTYAIPWWDLGAPKYSQHPAAWLSSTATNPSRPARHSRLYHVQRVPPLRHFLAHSWGVSLTSECISWDSCLIKTPLLTRTHQALLNNNVWRRRPRQVLSLSRLLVLVKHTPARLARW
jgi:hypothetical protein